MFVGCCCFAAFRVHGGVKRHSSVLWRQHSDAETAKFDADDGLCRWLEERKQGLEEYGPALQAAGILNIDLLALASDEQLCECGVASADHRHLLCALAQGSVNASPRCALDPVMSDNPLLAHAPRFRITNWMLQLSVPCAATLPVII